MPRKDTQFKRCEGPSIGTKFNHWTVTGPAYREGAARRVRLWVPCRCDCGTERNVRVYELTSNQSHSCGHDKHIARKRGLTSKELAAEQRLRYKYEIDLPTLRAMAERQGYLCAICRRVGGICKHGRIDRLTVDHDHLTGKVRGLLCDQCNRGLGMFKDDSARMFVAAEYLARHSSKVRDVA